MGSGFGIQSIEHLMEKVGVAPPGQLTVIVGSTVRLTLQVEYMGPAISSGAQIHAAFGVKGLIFNEDGNKVANVPIQFSQEATWRLYTFFVDIFIGGGTGTGFDLYAKIGGVPGGDIVTPYYMDVLNVTGEPQFRNFVITDYSKI